jgi:hypothetical protein
MTRIVRKSYPVARLPDDLRILLDPSKTVTLVMEQEDDAAARAPSLAFMRFFGAAKELDTSVESAVERIRMLRDERDDDDDRIHDMNRRP